MKSITYSRPFDVPEVNDFPNDYAHFAVLVPKYRTLFDFLTSDDSVASILAATDMNIDIPGIASVAVNMGTKFRSTMTDAEWYQAKQFAGVVVMLIHNANGYKKLIKNGSAVQRRVIVEGFNKGQVYTK